MAPPGRRRVRFDTDNVEIQSWVVSRRFMRPSGDAPNEGDPVDIPDPLPAAWLARSAAALLECQQIAIRWHEDFTTPTKIISVPALPTTTGDESVATPTLESHTPTRSTAALSRTWVLDSGSAHHMEES